VPGLETCRPVPCHYRLYVRGCTDSTSFRLIVPQQVFPFPNAVCPCSYCRSKHRTSADGSAGAEKAEIRVDWRRFLLSILTPTSSFETHESHTGIGTGRLAPKYMQTELAREDGACLIQYPSARRLQAASSNPHKQQQLTAFPQSAGDHLYVESTRV
jgi:hypothetical protein